MGVGARVGRNESHVGFVLEIKSHGRPGIPQRRCINFRVDLAITIYETLLKHLAMDRRSLKYSAEIQIPSWLVVIKVTDAVKISGDDQGALIHFFEVVLNFRMGKKAA